MDRTAAPCVNFFQYACGTWNRRHVIPEDRSSISTFEVLANQLQVILKRILEESPNADDNNATLKAKMFYKSCMDIRGYNENAFRSRVSNNFHEFYLKTILKNSFPIIPSNKIPFLLAKTLSFSFSLNKFSLLYLFVEKPLSFLISLNNFLSFSSSLDTLFSFYSY